MDKVLLIVGPTACGKSAAAVDLARIYDAEIISADSVQIYRQLNIGSAKITKEETKGIKHHLIDCLDYDASYSVYDFQQQGRAIIADLHKRNRLPIVVGGTGLYLKALIYDYSFPTVDLPPIDYRDLTNQELLELIQTKDPPAAEKLHVNNRQRLLTTIRLLDQLPGSKTDFLALQRKKPLYDALFLGLTIERKLLHERIRRRVDKMWEDGLLEEVDGLVKDNPQAFDYQSMQAIGYKEFRGYYQGNKSLEAVDQEICTHTRQFAKRQYTWFNNQLPINWLVVNRFDYEIITTKIIDQWLAE